MSSDESSQDFSRKKCKKGLKLILKVERNSASDSVPNVEMKGSEEEYEGAIISSSHHKIKKSKKKKRKKDRDYDKDRREKRKKHKKDKKKRHRDIEMEERHSSDDEEMGSNGAGGVRVKEEDFSPLQKLLLHLHEGIQKKDTNQFFAWPVTDQIAPGYSQVISHPMDLNSMHRKIINNSYPTLLHFQKDLKLMCDNAMIYNHEETIYYKAAKKLLHAGLKMTSSRKVSLLSATLPYFKEITRYELGYPSDEEDSEEIESRDVEMEDGSGEQSVRKNTAQAAAEGSSEFANKDIKVESGLETRVSCDSVIEPSKFEAIADLPAEEILAQAKKAAKEAAAKLAAKSPHNRMGFLRRRPDGTTSLAVLVANDTGDEIKREKPVNLAALIGRIHHGTGRLQGLCEDKRNIVKTVKPMYYGPFGSYAPSYDSTFANLTKEESELIFQTYGDETGVQYAESVLNFVQDCDYATTMVDNLLDIMTGGEHRKSKRYLEERKMLKMQEQKDRVEAEGKKASEKGATTMAESAAANEQNQAAIAGEMQQLQSLSELGIDTSFLDYFKGEAKDENAVILGQQLEDNKQLIDKLHKVQQDRLSAPLPAHLANVMTPTQNECQLADKVTENLTEMIKKIPPGAIATIAGVRKVMGIDCNIPTTSQSHFGDVPGGVNATLDFESELRELLENSPSLGFNLADDDADRTIEQMLS